MGAAARLSDGGTELRRDAEGACQGNRPWPEAGTRSGAKAEAARGKEEGSLSLVAIEVCVENTDGLVATWVRDSGRVGAAARADDHPLGLVRGEEEAWGRSRLDAAVWWLAA